MIIIAREGPYYVTETPGRSQAYTLRRQAGWLNDRHTGRDRTLGFYARREAALHELRLAESHRW